MKTNMYTAALQFKIAVTVTESFSIHEILIYLTREIVIKCFNAISENHVQLITQLVKKINKKNQKIFRKILTVKKLFCKNIVIIINMKKTKKQLKQNNN